MLHIRAFGCLRTARRAVALAAVVTLTIAGAAIADNVQLDGDTSDTSNSKNSTLTLCPGVGGSVNVEATLRYSGSEHFRSGGTVTITTAVAPAATGFLTAAGGSVVTNNWDSNSDTVTTAPMAVTVGTNWVPGSYRVNYTFSGLKTNGATYSIDDFNHVTIAERATGCGGGTGGPTNVAPTVNVTGFLDGDEVEIGAAVDEACSVSDDQPVVESDVDKDVTGPVGPLAAYGLGVVTVTCSYTDAEGATGTDMASFTIVDTGNPVITDLGPITSPNANGWYDAAVTNGFRATDTGAGFEAPTPPLLSFDFDKSTGAAEGEGITVSSGTVADVAGNEAEAIDSEPFNIDLSDPELNVSGAASGSFDVCSTPSRPSFDPTDAVSGIATYSDSWTTPGGTGIGTYTYEARATDLAGRSASETRTYSTSYGAAFTGVGQPINRDGTSRFKLGSTVPVKFRLECTGSPIGGAVASLTVRKADSTPDAGNNEAISTAAATTGNLFRYDATAGQYIFNLSTKSGYLNPGGATVAFAQGTWVLSIALDDGSTRTVNIQLVK